MTSCVVLVVVFKILEASAASRYLKNPNTKRQCDRPQAVQRTQHMRHKYQALSPGETPECLPKPHTSPCVQVTRRDLGLGISPRETLSLPLGRPWAADGGQ